jgi:hypothetical protein
VVARHAVFFIWSHFRSVMRRYTLPPMISSRIDPQDTAPVSDTIISPHVSASLGVLLRL